MSTVRVSVPAREASISAVIIRADGTREELGVISYWHKNPLRRLAWRVRRWLKG
jgi:hypothetical protein